MYLDQNIIFLHMGVFVFNSEDSLGSALTKRDATCVSKLEDENIEKLGHPFLSSLNSLY